MTVLKKRTPMTLPTQSAGKPAPKLPKPATKQTDEAPKKLGVKTNAEAKTKPEKPGENGKSAEAPKPTVSKRTAKPAASGEPRSPYPPERVPEDDRQVTLLTMRDMSFAQKHELWRQVQTLDEFVTILKPDEVPRKMVREDPAGVAPTKDALWCCYCTEWQPFRLCKYTGYKKCVCCGISTKDFYNCTANKLWNKEW